MTVALCCDDKKSGDILANWLRSLCDVSAEAYDSITDFITNVMDHPDTVMLVAQTGAHSTETAITAREQNPQGKLIWFSDLDFALLSFRLKATYFGLLPIENDKLKTALAYCGIPTDCGEGHNEKQTG